VKESAVRAASIDAAMPALSIVIPAFNEATRIELALDRVLAFVAERDLKSEILVVDDGSSDSTALIVQRYIAGHPEGHVQLHRMGQNRGKGAALRKGVLASRGARVLVMDADLATPIEMLDRLWRALDEGAEVAIGSRATYGSNIRRSQSMLRVLFGRAGNLWIQALAVPGVHDTQCGFKLFEGEWGRRIWKMSREERFGVDVEVLCLARRRFGLRIAEVGVSWEHRDGSKVRLKDYFDVFLKVPRIVWSVLRAQE
jgi:glycosyltransferase involved in cell wall biosynthesis